jgi:uncharacterized protein YcbK (DUF882 family)
MSPRGLSVLALAGLLAASGFAFALWPRNAPAAQQAPLPSAASSPPPPPLASAPAPRQASSRFALLPALRIQNQTTREQRTLRLYDADGHIDEAAARELDELLCDARRPQQHESTRLDRRTLQLLFKAAYHFQSSEVEVVSAYRKPGRRREGPHGNGSAIDFRLLGVSARDLASYLRRVPRTGVGVYTHPKTQYVHLDSREHSFHWLDASPPRRHWREKSIGAADLPQRDALYSALQDLP